MRDLQADLQICNKATPGPWYREKTGANFNGFTLESLIGTTSIYTTGNNIYAQPQGGTSPSNDADFIAAAREGWPEAIERAIKAEMELHDVWTITDIYKISAAVLREENELQRQSIQDLSQRVVRLRAGLERIKTTIEEYHPHDTLTLPRFSFAKELHDIALAELEG